MNLKLRPYISLDIETTGLSKTKSEILQIGAILDDGLTPVDKLSTIDVLIRNPHLTHVEYGALKMNMWMFPEMENPDSKYTIMPLRNAMADLQRMVFQGILIAQEWDKAKGYTPKEAIQFAGKNVGSFDAPIIDNACARWGVPPLKGTCYRTIDPGSLYLEEFGTNRGLGKINKLTGREPVCHHAVDDAMDVVYAIRKKVGVDV